MSNNVDVSFQSHDKKMYNTWLAKLLNRSQWNQFDRWDGTNKFNMHNVAHYHPPSDDEIRYTDRGPVAKYEYWNRIRDYMQIYKNEYGIEGSGNDNDNSVYFKPVPDSEMIPEYHQLLYERKDYQKAIKLGLTIPFSHNTGPGNTPVEPSNTADEHALQHDLEYSKGGDVSESDTNFVNKMLDHALGDNVGSISQITGLLGGVGIKAKQAIESKTGQIYPAGNVET